MVRVNASSASIESGVYVHPSALCESDDIGDGTRIWAFAHIMPGAVIGRDCNIGDQVFVEGGARIGARVTVKNQVMVWEGVTVEDEVFLGPGMIFTNDLYPRSARMPQVADRYRCNENWLVPTTVGRGASIGAGAVILCGVTIGPYAMIGAGAVVVCNVSAHRLFVGQPAKAIGWVCGCGMRLDSSLRCPTCGQSHTCRDDRLEIA
ncbi:MAG: N-acetyltransferase [Planctomycetes bacterium]|nr:N-acetyltransferase [Planctomycetota bacterium]